VLLALLITWRQGDRMLYVLAGLCAGYGLLLALARALPATHMLAAIVGDLRAMPVTMRRLAWVQFFSWFALFAMWIYTTAAVAGAHFGSTEPSRRPTTRAPTGWACCSAPTTVSPRWRRC
jgi:maltose/moltooligosaccharide transporter